MSKLRVPWLNAEWDADTICTPQGVPYCYQIYGYPVAPGSSRLNNWVPLSLPLPESFLSIEPSKAPLETVGVLSVTVTLDPPDSDDTITVNYATANGTAIAGINYTAASGTLTFAPNDTTETIPVTIIDANIVSPLTFTIVLSSPTNASITVGTCTVTIQPDAGST